MKNAVIEKAGTNMHVTLHFSDCKAVDYAVQLALENTSCNEDEIRDNIKNTDSHEEGDYGVYVVFARNIE